MFTDLLGTAWALSVSVFNGFAIKDLFFMLEVQAIFLLFSVVVQVNTPMRWIMGFYYYCDERENIRCIIFPLKQTEDAYKCSKQKTLIAKGKNALTRNKIKQGSS